MASNPKSNYKKYGLPSNGKLTRAQMRETAQRIGLLNLQKKEIDKELECLKHALKAEILEKIPESESKTGSMVRELENVGGFTCKVYDRTQLRANQKKAREVLDQATFDVIFTPSTSTILDVRADLEMSQRLADEIRKALRGNQ